MRTLFNSNLCRLCAIESESGSLLFEEDCEGEICTLLNDYLPFKVEKDETLPRKLCAECNASLHHVAKFFDKIIKGQKTLQEKIFIQKTETCSGIDYREKQKSENDPHYHISAQHLGTSLKIIEKLIAEEQEKIISLKIGDDPKTYICDTCGEKFCRRNSIIHHIRTQHNGNRFYNCNKCRKGFITAKSLNEHIERIHTAVRLYECIQCHSNFTSQDDLYAHSQSYCKQSTIVRKSCNEIWEFGKSHKCRKDKKPSKVYRCDVCDKIFPYSSNLYRHKKIHSNERPYQCTKCDRKFPTLSRLNMHENEHEKKYSYKCTICQKCFVNNRILQVHCRRHMRVFPFECDVCSKGFPDKCTLVKHTRVHTGERPYHCDLCGKSFADQSNFIRHKKVHNKMDSLKLPKNKPIGFKETKKSNRLRIRSRMKMDLSSMTYSEKKQYDTPTDELATLASKPTKMSILEKAIENIIQEYDTNPKPENIKKCIYFDNSAKQFLLLDSARTDKNVVLIPPLVLDSPTQVLKSVKNQSYVVVKKSNSSNDAKVIVIRNANKIIMQRSIKKDTPHLTTGTDCYEETISSNQLPDLYSYEGMTPSPTFEYIDVEDLVATFTSDISFEEMGDLKDLVNTKIDL